MGGGGGGGAPTQSTQYSTNIPEYAKPYVSNMLGATQGQLFNTSQTGQGQYDINGNATTNGGYDAQGNPQAGTETITGFKPYQPYSSNVNDYFAGPSPMQQQSYQGMANMQVAPQLAEGSQFAGVGGAGSLGIAGQAANVGQNYANMATNPNSISAYMSPYMQNVVDYQKSSAMRDYAMAQPKLQAAAVGQGAFGGNRMAIQQAEAQRGLGSQLQGIEAQGAQQAFQNAQQAQQFGANLGLQGYQTGLQGYNQAINAGSTLGQLGQTQYGQQMGIIQGQNQFGQQQQQMEQQKINQAISDYATAQQYPMMQLGFMSNMLRGLPLQATTTQSYQATPGIYQQGIGTIGALAGAKQAGMFKEGGAVKGLAAGGAIRYANTGMVEANPQSSVVSGMQAKLATMTEEQLQVVANTSPSEEVRKMANEMIAQKEIEKQAEQKAEQSMPQQPMVPPPQSQGIAAAPAGSMDTLQAAGGGIIAFANKGAVEDLTTLESDEDRLARLQKQQELVGITGKPMEGYGKYLSEKTAGMPELAKQNQGYNLIDFATRFGTTTGGPLYAAQQAAQGMLPDAIKRQESLNTREGQLAKGQAEIENADRLEKMGFIKEGNDEREKGLNRIKDLEVANIHARATSAAANRPSDLDKTAKAIFDDLVAKGANPKDPSTTAIARQKAIEMTGMSGAKLGVNMESKIDAAHKQIDAKYATPLLMAEDDKERAAIEAKIKAEKDAVARRYNEAASLLNADGGGGAPAPQAGPVVVDGYQFPDQAKADAYLKAKAGKPKG